MAFMPMNVAKKEDAFPIKLKFSGGNGMKELKELKDGMKVRIKNQKLNTI